VVLSAMLQLQAVHPISQARSPWPVIVQAPAKSSSKELSEMQAFGPPPEQVIQFESHGTQEFRKSL
jgi:hypothetical protein